MAPCFFHCFLRFLSLFMLNERSDYSESDPARSSHYERASRTVNPAQSYQPDHKYQPLPKYQPSPQDPDEFKSLALELLSASPVQSFSQKQITSAVDGQVTYDAANQFPEAAETDISMDSEPDYAIFNRSFQ